MSLISNSTYRSKRGSLQNQVSVKMTVTPGPDPFIIGYSPVKVTRLVSGDKYAWMLDFPSQFYAFTSISQKNDTQDAMVLFSHLGSYLHFGSDGLEKTDIRWFCDLSEFTVPPPPPETTQVWFCLQNNTGNYVDSLGVILLELIFAKAVKKRAVLPVIT